MSEITIKIKKAKPIYFKVGKTVINAGKVESLKDVMPSYQEIVTHILTESANGKKELTPIVLQLKPHKMIEFQTELKVKTGYKVVPAHYIMFLEQEKFPIILLK